MNDKNNSIDYKKYIDSLLTYNGLLDPAGTLLMANRTIVEQAGLSYDDVIGKYFPDTYWWSYDPAVQKRLGTYIEKAKKGETVISEEKVRLAKGYAPVQFSLKPILDEKGKVEYLLAEGKEITDIKEAEKEIRRSHELLNAISNFAGIVGTDKKLRYANKRTIDNLGFTKEEVIGIPFWECGWFASTPETVNKIKHSIDIALQGKRNQFEFKIFTRAGREIPIYYSATPMRDDLGNIIGVAVEGVNINELKEKEEALQKSEAMYRDLISNMNEGLAITDEMGNYTFVNPRFCEMMEYSPEEIGRMNVKDTLDDENRQLLLTRARKRAKGEFSRYEITFTTKSGKKLPALLSASPIMENGVFKGTLGVLTDLTELKKMESQLLHAQKMESVGILAGGIAHDFNNILQAIFGYTQILMLKKKPGDPDLKELEAIQESAQKASDLTKQLLIFGRKAESNPQPINLNQAVKEIGNMLLKRTIPKMIDIEFYLAENLEVIRADPVQIEQILMNLTVNAVDAMPEGGKLIFETENVILDEKYINSHLGAKPGEYVLLTVSDTGGGMDKITLEHIFEPFFTTKEKGQGTGLGLATVYGIVKEHDGYITCYSEPGQGTTFKIYFPVIETITERPTEDTTIEKKELPRGTETVLLVDDEEALRNLGQEILEREGFTVILAASGEKAVEIYKAQKDSIDLVILDISMPGMGGHRCFQELRRIDPEVKVIIATGYSANGRVKETINLGAAGFIGKPYRLADMLNKVREVLDEEK